MAPNNATTAMDDPKAMAKEGVCSEMTVSLSLVLEVSAMK